MVIERSALVRLVRIFVSSPGDVKAERAVLDEVVRAINETQAAQMGVRLELARAADGLPDVADRDVHRVLPEAAVLP
jgi:hypothetical protein